MFFKRIHTSHVLVVFEFNKPIAFKVWTQDQMVSCRMEAFQIAVPITSILCILLHFFTLKKYHKRKNWRKVKEI